MIRVANAVDVPQLAEIYAPYVLGWRCLQFALNHNRTLFSIWSSWDRLRNSRGVNPSKLV